MVQNKILDEIRKQERLESQPKEQWLHNGLCYACEKYGQCDYNPCEAYKKRQNEEIKKKVKHYEKR